MSPAPQAFIYALSVELRHETHASALARVQAIEETVMQILDVTEQTGRTPAYAALELVRHRLGTHFRPRRDWLREKTGFEPAYSVGGPGAASCRWACPLAPPLRRERKSCRRVWRSRRDCFFACASGRVAARRSRMLAWTASWSSWRGQPWTGETSGVVMRSGRP